MTRKTKIVWFLILAVVVVGVYYFFVNKQTSNKDEVEQEVISKKDLIINELATKYKATVGWEENMTYTIQAQERLITDNPSLFVGSIDDIFNRDGKEFIRFSSSIFSYDIEYVVELECNKEILNKILSEETNSQSFRMWSDYAVVANIQKVFKPIFALEGEIPEEGMVDINVNSSRLFIAKGTCLDIVSVEEN